MIAPGSASSTPISSPDIYATLLEVTEQHPMSAQTIDGQSLLPVFKGQDFPSDRCIGTIRTMGNQGGARRRRSVAAISS